MATIGKLISDSMVKNMVGQVPDIPLDIPDKWIPPKIDNSPFA